ncbi:hypothetical protein KL86DYS1_30681 [uncultured Dysgonomonas sp.]|uniref:Uncharacterized protein n=1 Tax=uncultured Dysgonomonas sp. TaxID=206096 RepID=A0A212JWQ5_9BACT|nr:hypothetical protein KL86DYS1_30681 [uncultured Dysgonomonas sp.]
MTNRSETLISKIKDNYEIKIDYIYIICFIGTICFLQRQFF